MNHHISFLFGNGKLDLNQFNNFSRQALAIYIINILVIFLAVFFITFNMVYLSDKLEVTYKIIRLTLTILSALLSIILLRIGKIHTAAILTSTLPFLILFYFPVFFRLNPMEVYITLYIVALSSCIVPVFVFRIKEDLRWIIGLTGALLLFSLTSDNLIIYRFGNRGDLFYEFYKSKIIFLALTKTCIVLFLSSTCIIVFIINQKHETSIKSIKKKLKDSNLNLEKLVQDRTKNLADKNKRLLEYTYINSHLLRGPVARLKGLMLLIDIDKSENNLKFCHTTINHCLGELDSIIEVINKILNDEDQSEIEKIQEKVRVMYSGISPKDTP